MTQHLTVDALADLLVGEGDAAAVAHLESCADCAGRLSELADAVEATDPLLAALAASPVPALPDGFEERLAERLEQEAREQARHRPSPRAGGGLVALPGRDDDEHDDEHRDARRGAAVPLQPRRGRPRGAGLLGVAAGATGLLVAGALGLSLLGGGMTSGGGSESTSGAVSAPEGVDQGAADSAGAAGGAGAAEAAPSSLADVQAASGAVVQSSGVDYRPEAAHVQDLLPGLLAGDYSGIDAAQPAPVAAAAEAQQSQQTEQSQDGTSRTTGPADPLARLREPAALQECLAALAGSSAGADPDATPLALDYTTSQGQPALVVALPAPGGLVEVSAVGAGCGAGDPQRLWALRVAG